MNQKQRYDLIKNQHPVLLLTELGEKIRIRKGGLKTDQIAEVINRRKLHVRKDGQPVTSAQVYAVVMRNCQVFHGRDVEDVYREYIEGTRTFDEIAKEYKRTF